MERSSGILLHISSLPSPHGIGTLGRSAYEFADFLAEAGQTFWQMLPPCPTGYGDSPYQSFSTFAGNPYFIDFELLSQDGLLEPCDYDGINWGDDETKVDFVALHESRMSVLKKAYERGAQRNEADVERFKEKHKSWIGEYALFMALKNHFGLKPFTMWEEDIKLRKPDAVNRYSALLEDDVKLHIYVQYLFFKQWDALKVHTLKKGIKLIGDLPIYIAMDSVDVWQHPENFLLEEDLTPKCVAGVPPDFFSATGQLWGNPIYDWGRLKQDGYKWWVNRMRAMCDMFDVIRFDHFRGLESYWSVPWGENTATNGTWVKGPGMEFISELKCELPHLNIIAEDLGYLTPQVKDLLEESGFPGMKLIQFAFDSREPGDYLPHTYPVNCVCYTGTHDNTTLAGWFSDAAPEDVVSAKKYLGLNEEEGFCTGMLRGGMSSVAKLFVAQMQDYLELGTDARMNTPGTLGINWQWRMKQTGITKELSRRVREMTELYDRI